MEISTRVVGEVTILDLKGRFVYDDHDDTFRDTINTLVRQGVRKILLNLDQVTYIDSAGLGMMVSKFITIHKRDGQMKLCNIHPRSFRVLDITKLLTVFQSYDTEADALKSFEDDTNPGSETGLFG